jgi:5-methylthioadenosine/S-adenosylhomocysteine deaminase
MSGGLTVIGASLAGQRVGLRCVDGTVEAIDAGGALLVPPLANGHTHAAMTLFRGYGGDLPLMRWLKEKVWPVEARLEGDDVYWGTRLACVEMIRTGTASFWDMYWHPEETSRAVRDAGLRATVGQPLFGLGEDFSEIEAIARASLQAQREFAPGVGRALAPHSIYTAGEPLLRWTAETAAELDLPVHIHLSETEQEVNDCVAEHGLRPAAYLDRLGLLGERTLLAHGVWLDREELELIAERGATVVSNPVANMKLAVGGVLPYPAARAAGVRLGLGTDGAGSNDSLDLMADLKVFALTQRHAAGDATVIAAEDAWEIAIGAASPLLAGGPIAVGGPADFLLLRQDSPELGIGELASDLVYAASGAVVDTTVVAGTVLMREGRVEGAEEIVARAAERARGLGIG